jgi:hypothetical protein
MHAVTNRAWTLWFAAIVVVSTIGCRGSRPFASIVKVTQDNDPELANIDVPKQRLSTAKPRTTSPDTAPAQSKVSSTKLSATTTDPSPQSSVRDETAAKRSLSSVPSQTSQQSSALDASKPRPASLSAVQSDSRPTEPTGRQAAKNSNVQVPSGDAEDLMFAFKDYPPEVQREALRRLIAATARSAERSSQPEAVRDQLHDRLADLPELPDAAAGDPDAPSPQRIATDRVSSSSVVSATTPANPAKSSPKTGAESHITELQTTELQPAVAQLGDAQRTKTPGEVKTAAVSAPTEPEAVAQASVEKELSESATKVSAADLQAELDHQPGTLTSDELFAQLVQQLSIAREGESEADRASRLIKLRHLMVLSGDPDGAVEQVDGMGESEQEYLRHQLLGLWTMIDPHGHPVPSRRFSTAVPQIREAAKFAAAATDALEVRSLAFCTEIESYGQVKPFKNSRFEPGQQVILYCEIENFTAEKTEEGFETHLQGSYDLFNGNDEKVVSQLLPADQQVSANYLRDYFIAYQMHLPEQLAAGKYRLQLTMEDVNGKKYGQSSIPLEIKK